MVSSNPNLATGGTSAACYHSGVLNTNVLYIHCRTRASARKHLAGMQIAQHCAQVCLQLREINSPFSDTTSSQELHSYSLSAATDTSCPSLTVFFLFRLLTTHNCSTSCIEKLYLITSKYLLN